MISKAIKYCGQPLILICDAKCSKAWGSIRPHISHSETDEDDVEWYADDELPDAPACNGNWEGDQGKPTMSSERLNKWCARQCERSVMIEDGKDFVLPDWGKRRFNQPWKHGKSEED